MTYAIIAFIPTGHVLGQSVGCLVPIKRESVPIGEIARIGKELRNDSRHERIEVVLLGPHDDIPANNCLSVAFHLPVSMRPVVGKELDRRVEAVRKWIQQKFGITSFKEKVFPSRIELCDYLCSDFHAM